MVNKEQKSKERAGGKGYISSPKIAIVLMAALMLSLCIAVPLANMNNEDNIIAGDHRAPVLGEVEIYTYQELQSITDFTADYILMADIVCPSGVNFRPIGYDTDDVTVTAFTGSFDGNGYVIDGMNVDSYDGGTSYYQYAGLFAQLDASAKISNLGLINNSVTSIQSTGDACAGGIAASISYTSTNAEITNCYNEGNVLASSTSRFAYAGGIIGFDDGFTATTDCYNTGDVSASSSSDNAYAGGIAGNSVGTITDHCYNEGNISATTSSSISGALAGGIKGHAISYTAATITDCYNIGNVSAESPSPTSVTTNTYAGGIVGTASGLFTITGCYNTGDVSASSTNDVHAGGIAGYSNGVITNCYNEGDVSASLTSSAQPTSDAYAGGIIGSANGDETITNCYNTGDVSASSASPSSYDVYAGGILGVTVGTNSTITGCYNTGDVSASSASPSYGACAGGILGYTGMGQITGGCYNTGDVSASSPISVCAGGILGATYATTSITGCYNTGSMAVAAPTMNSGPIAGNNTATVTDCYWLDTLGFLGGLPVGDMTGSGALGNMPGFSSTDWFANAEGDFDDDRFATYFPQLLVFAGSSDPKIQTDSIVSVSILTNKINVSISQTGTYEYVQGNRLSALVPLEKSPTGIPGIFTWKDGNYAVKTTDTSAKMVFTPNDFRYKTVTFDVAINVIEGHTVPTITPTGTYTYVEGEKLHANVPTEISPAGIPGTFTWLNGNDIVKMGDTSKPMMFTPYDANYSPATFNVPITVTKGPAITVPSTPPTGGPTTVPTITQTGVYSYVQGEKIHANVPTEVTPAGIPGVFTWKNGNHVVTTRDTSTAMVFTPYDGRYSPVTFNVSITVNEAVPGSDNNSSSSDNDNDVMLTVLVGCLLSAVIGAVVAVVAGMIIRKH